MRESPVHPSRQRHHPLHGIDHFAHLPHLRSRDKHRHIGEQMRATLRHQTMPHRSFFLHRMLQRGVIQQGRMAIAIQCLSKQGIIHRGNVERVSRVPASTLFHYLHRGGHQPGDVGGVAGQDHGVALLGDVAESIDEPFGDLEIDGDQPAFALYRVGDHFD